MNKNIYIVYATNEDGVIITEVFDDIDEALHFEKYDIKDKVRTEYSDKAADSKHLSIGFSVRVLHTKQTDDNSFKSFDAAMGII